METPFSREQLILIASLFSQAVESEKSQREAILSEVRTADPPVYVEVRRLLKLHDDNEPPDSPPSSRYRILKELSGDGGSMGKVYLAHDSATGEDVAIKRLPDELAGNRDWLKRFRREVGYARKIADTNVCRVYELVPDAGVLWISMEYIEGETLRKLLDRRQGVSTRQALDISSQIASGLSAAHAKDVIHRDIKPENIMIAVDGTVKIMDFGIAQPADKESPPTAHIIGTVSYMSPEQASGGVVDARSDIYSLGLVMYELFCGKSAFKDEDILKLLEKQAHETPQPPIDVDQNVPSFINQIILKCIEKERENRFTSVVELQEAIDTRKDPTLQVTIPRDPPPPPSPLPEYMTRWLRADWMLIFAAACGLLLFFPFSQRINLGTRIAVRYEPVVFGHIAEEFGQKLHATLAGPKQITAISHADRYNYVTSLAGTKAALELSDNPIPYLIWQVRWENGTVIDLTNRGSLLNFSRNVGPRTESISSEQGLQIATAAVRELFEDPAARPDASGDVVWQGQPATSYTWSDPKDYQGMRRQYVVRLVGKEVASLESDFAVPAGYVQPSLGRQVAGYLTMLTLLLGVGIAKRKQVNLQSRWRIVIAILSSIMIGRLLWLSTERLGAPMNLTAAIFVHTAIGWSVIMFFILVALENAISRSRPDKLISVIRLFGREFSSEACGLAILRGTLIGLAVLGLDAVLVWLATRYLRMTMNGVTLTLLEVYLNSRFAGVQRTLFAILLTPIQAAYFAWLGSLALRPGKRAWFAPLLSAALVAMILPIYQVQPTASLLQPYAGKVLVLFLEVLILLWGFARFDFLTLMISLFTFTFCSGSYLSLKVLAHIGAPQETAVLAAWALFVSAAACIAFQRQLKPLFR